MWWVYLLVFFGGGDIRRNADGFDGRFQGIRAARSACLL